MVVALESHLRCVLFVFGKVTTGVSSFASIISMIGLLEEGSYQAVVLLLSLSSSIHHTGAGMIRDGFPLTTLDVKFFGACNSSLWQARHEYTDG